MGQQEENALVLQVTELRLSDLLKISQVTVAGPLLRTLDATRNGPKSLSLFLNVVGWLCLSLFGSSANHSQHGIQ